MSACGVLWTAYLSYASASAVGAEEGGKAPAKGAGGKGGNGKGGNGKGGAKAEERGFPFNLGLPFLGGK